MRFRTMRQRLTFKKPPERVEDILGGSSNGKLSDYETVVTVWGRIRPMSGDELPEHESISASTTHKVKIRYTPLVNSPTMIFEYNGRTFQLTAPPKNTGELDKELILFAEELVP